MDETLILGRVLSFTGDPLIEGPDAARFDEAVLIREGRIVEVGARRLRDRHPGAKVVDHGDALISAGFVDAHAHYPQTAIVASWGKRLIDWLNTYTFPEEMRFGDPPYAAEVAGRFLDLALAHGTTSVASFCTTHSVSVDAFFEAAKTRGMAVAGGSDLHGPQRAGRT